MGLIFRKNATSRQKVIASLIFITISLCITAILSDILVAEEIGKPLAWLGAITSIMLVAYSEILLCIKDSAFRKNIEAQGKALWKARLSLIFIIPIFIYPSIFKGIPAIAHLFSSTNGSIEVTVRKRASSYRDKHCDGGIYLREYQLFGNTEICGIHKNHWDKLSPGQKIRLYGQKSIFGFTFEKYQVLSSN